MRRNTWNILKICFKKREKRCRLLEILILQKIQQKQRDWRLREWSLLLIKFWRENGLKDLHLWDHLATMLIFNLGLMVTASITTFQLEQGMHYPTIHPLKRYSFSTEMSIMAIALMLSLKMIPIFSLHRFIGMIMGLFTHLERLVGCRIKEKVKERERRFMCLESCFKTQRESAQTSTSTSSKEFSCLCLLPSNPI